MYAKVIALSASLVIAAAGAGFAMDTTHDKTPGKNMQEKSSQSGSSGYSPGHQMQDKGSKGDDPGASGYSPGHQMQDKGSKGDAPGASGYAPGHSDDYKSK